MHAQSDVHPLQIGVTAPDVELSGSDGGITRLGAFRGQPCLLVFFPQGWDPTRRQQIELYADMLRDAPHVAHVLGISYDGTWCELQVGMDESVRFPLLNDVSRGKEAARLFGVAGCHAAFLIDAEGVIRWRHAAPPGTPPAVEDLLDALSRAGTWRLSRREFLMSMLAASALAALSPEAVRAQSTPLRDPQPGSRNVVLNVNGTERRLTLDPRVTLLDALRERLGLYGTKKGCDHGQCGACTVHVDGRRVNSCLMLAAQAEGASITTIEGLARGEALHPVQAAFISTDGFQCGYCTPGQIMSAVACIAEGHARSENEIREWMSGNICRCGAYRGICKAVQAARDEMARKS
jgi:xanthine dehydrogenase YagT iron-sulfur-binding subunit